MRTGTLEFFDGIPTKKTAALLYDNLDFLRGGETFLNGMPAALLEGLRRGQVSLGAENFKPGRGLRSVDGQQSPVAHRQHRHGLLHRFS